MVESTRRFLLYTKMCQDAKKLAVFRHLHKIAPKFDHRLYFFLGGGRLDYIGKVLKTKIKFNYKLYFYSNTFNSCIQNKIQPMVDSTHRFLTVIKIYQVVKNCLHFINRTKMPQNSTIDCTSVFGHVWEMLAKS